MVSVEWWTRLVGAYYVVSFVAVVAHAPIKTRATAGVIDHAAADDSAGRFVFDAWTTLGLVLGLTGASILYFSQQANDPRTLARTIIAIELAWGVPIDIFKIARGYPKQLLFPWLILHAAIVTSGIIALGSVDGTLVRPRP